MTAVVLGLVLVSACGGSGAVGGTIEITGQDYGFAGLPEVAASGAELTFTNGSDVEFHEMVVLRIADGEERTLQELLELPDEESESLVEFQGVLVALPGEDGFNPAGRAPRWPLARRAAMASSASSLREPTLPPWKRRWPERPKAHRT